MFNLRPRIAKGLPGYIERTKPPCLRRRSKQTSIDFQMLMKTRPYPHVWRMRNQWSQSQPGTSHRQLVENPSRVSQQLVTSA